MSIKPFKHSASTRIKSARIVQLSQPAMRSQDTEREPVPGARDAERPLPDARRTVARRSEGNKNALKHGDYTAEAITRRRAIAKLLREAKAVLKEVS